MKNKWHIIPLKLPKGYKMIIFGDKILVDNSSDVEELRKLLKEAGFKKF